MKCSFKAVCVLLAATLLVLWGTLTAACAATLSGTIYGGSAPMEGATIAVKHAGGTEVVATTKTDLNGFYSIGNLNGKYDLSIIPPEGSDYSLSAVTGVDLAGPDVVQNVVLITAAPRMWTLTGTIYGGDAPLPYVYLVLKDAATSRRVESATTNGNGGYGFAVLDGTYDLSISPPSGKGFVDSAVTGIVVSGGNVIRDVTLVNHGVTISGTVRNSDGSVPTEVDVYAQGVDGQAGSARVDATGQYSMVVLPGTYTIATSKLYWDDQIGYFGSYGIPEVAKLSVTENTTQDITAAFPAPVRISGKTTDYSGVPVPDVRVYMTNQYSSGPDVYGGYTNISMSNNGWGHSREDGSFSYPLLPAPGYTLTLSPWTSKYQPKSYPGISLTGDLNRDFALGRSLSFSGTIRDQNGSVISLTGVSLVGTNGESGDSATVDADGHYSLWVAPGTYNLRVGKAYTDKLGQVGHYDFTALKEVSVTGDVIKDVTANFPKPFTISGKTTDASLRPVGNVSIEVTGYYSSGPDDNGGTTYVNVRNIWPVYSDADGNYAFTLLPGPEYSFTVRHQSDRYLPQTYGISLTADTYQDLPLGQALTVSGTVRNKDGSIPTDPVWVGAVGVYGETVGGATLGVAGDFSFGLRPGTFDIKVTRYYRDSHLGTIGSYTLTPLKSYSITENLTRDFTADFPDQVTISGKTTDANGVPIPNVTLGIANYGGGSGPDANGGYSSLWFGGQRRSDAEGGYSFSLLPADRYSLSIQPPGNFVGAYLSDFKITGSMLQNYVMALPDTKAPAILSPPAVASKSEKTAVIEWQTNEPAKGSVLYGTTNPPGIEVPESAAQSATYHSQQLTGLAPNTTYYVMVTATDDAGNGPTHSAVASFRTDGARDTTPPSFINGPAVNNITHVSAVVEWTTSEPTTSVIVYGVSNEHSVTDDTLSTSHRVTLSGLARETLYHLQVTATDAAGNSTVSNGAVSFMTGGLPDTTPPIIVEGPMAIDVSDTAATITWTTDENATSGVSWNSGGVYDLISDAAAVVKHAVTMTNLAPSTTYSYTVASRDVFGNGPTLSTVKTFTTRAAPDRNPPVFTQPPIVKNTTHQSAVLYWETDEMTSSTIVYGISQTPGQTDTKAALLTKHNRPLTGLLPGITYYFQIIATDAAGNTSTSKSYSFTTDQSPDTKAPVITKGASIIYATDTAATVAFSTDKPCGTVVNYGPNGLLRLQKSESERTNSHQVTLTNLTPNTSYTTEVSCTDISGNTVVASAGSPSTLLAMNYANLVSDAVVGASGTGFITASEPDVTAPAITMTPAASALTSSQARIVWATDEIADSQVFYGPADQGAVYSAGDIAQVRDHSVVLTNLAPAATYSFKVQSVDPSGNVVTSWLYTFTTAALADTAPPVISAISTTGAEPTEVTIKWTTDEPATTVVKYGSSASNLTGQISVPGLTTSHSVTLYNLVSGTTYYLAPVSADGSANTTQGATNSITLPGQAPNLYTVKATAGNGGTIAPGSQSVFSGLGLSLAVTPDAGYLAGPVTGCGGSLVGNVYNTAAISGDCTVSASFRIDPDYRGAPGAPTAASASAGNGHATVSFSAPSVTGGVITGYTVTSHPAGGTDSNAGSSSLSHVVTGLANGTTYTFTVTATNAAGSGAASVPSNEVTPTDGACGAAAAGTFYSAPTSGLCSAGAASAVTGTGPWSWTCGTVTCAVAKSTFYATPTPITGYPASSTYTSGISGTRFSVLRSEGGRDFVPIVTNTAAATFTDTSSLKPNTVYQYLVTSDSDPNQTVFMTIRTPLYNGWNIVAVPYNTTGIAPSTFFANPVSAVYQWMPTGATTESSTTPLGFYRTVTALNPGYGYFVKASNSGTLLNYNGAAGLSSATVTLKPGWTMIANPNAINKTNIGTTWLVDGKPLSEAIQNSKIGGSIYWWNGTTYDSWTILGNGPQVEPWKGYWIINLDSVDHLLTIR